MKIIIKEFGMVKETWLLASFKNFFLFFSFFLSSPKNCVGSEVLIEKAMKSATFRDTTLFSPRQMIIQHYDPKDSTLHLQNCFIETISTVI